MPPETERIIFLDESGDLGWSFGAPYRDGGSSRYLTIGAISVCKELFYLPSRFIRELYKEFSWDPKIEKKWTHMNGKERLKFATKAKKLIKRHPSLKYFGTIVYKPKVKDHIKKDANKLYNYLIKETLLDEMAKYSKIYFYPDPRSIKVNSGNSLSDYLQTELYFTKNVSTKLITRPENSSENKGVQFADMLSGLIQQHYQDKNSGSYDLLKKDIFLKNYFFDSQKS